jgi:hypothetical protein
MNPRAAYALAGGLASALAIAMALGPLARGAFVLGTLAYQFLGGACLTVVVAFVLDVIGHEGAVTTKYALFMAAANLAYSYTAVIDGWGYDVGRTRGLLLADAATEIAGLGVLGVMTLLTRSRGGR